MSADTDKQSFMVQAEDGRKFKMVIRGDLAKIPVEKIRRYLKAYGVPDGQTLTFDGYVLTDDMLGEDFGLQANSVLKLWSQAPPTSRIQATMEAASDLAIDVEGRQRQQQYEDNMRQQQGFDRPSRAAPIATSPVPARSAPPFGGTPTQSRHESAAAATSSYHSTQLPSAAAASHHPLQQQVQQLELDNSRLRREVDALKLELEAKRLAPQPVESLLANAKANLIELGKELGMHLALDQSLTCAIGNDERHTILVTFDPPTERLYVYSTLLSFIPDDARLRLTLFEALLDGALLGRDVAGGGIGASVQSGVIMMATSLPLRHCGPGALRELVPVFIESLVRWRGVVAEIVNLERR